MIQLQRSIKALKAKASGTGPDTPSKVKDCNDNADSRFTSNEEHSVKHSDQKEQNLQSNHNKVAKSIQRHWKVSLLKYTTILKLRQLIYPLKVYPSLSKV
jgi:hypothetical protein